MKIGYISNSTVFKGSIDENKKRVYNIRKIREDRLISDVFESRAKSSLKKKTHPVFEAGINMADKDITDYIQSLSTNKMQKSPVAYALPLITRFLEGEISEDEFSRTFMDETEKTRFIFAHMDKEDISANQNIFRKELTFADELYKLAANNEATRESLLAQIEKYSKES